MAVAAGIDFGTSNTAVTLWQDGRVRPVPVDLASVIADTIPTLLFFPPRGEPVFGSTAVTDYLATDMAGRLIQSIKRYLPSDTFQGTMLGGKLRSLEDLIGGFLLVCKRALDEAAGQPVERVLMGRPAVFHVDPARDALAQGRLERAAALAGFRQIQVQLEPIAAARAFERSLEQDTLCLIGDLGGGTSDFTLIRLGPGRVGRRDRRQDVLGSGGVDVAGNDIDARIIHTSVLPSFGYGSSYRPVTNLVPLPTFLHIAATRWHRLCVEAADPKNLSFLDRAIRTSDDPDGLTRFREFLARNYGYSLFRAVERTKIALSGEDHTRLRFREGSVDIDEALSRADLEQAIGRELGALGDCMDGLLGRLGVAHDAVGLVFLTGGTSQIPAVAELFERRFPGRIVARDAFTAVGLGLGLEAGERYC